MRLSESDSKLLGRCIEELEARTEAEVVLVLRPRSGHYRDVSYLVGAASAFFLLCFFLYSPFEFPPYAIPLPIIAAFTTMGWVSQHSSLRRWLTRARRRRQQVETDARAAFVERKIHTTGKGIGILLYCSRLERDAVILPDLGAAARLDPAKLEEFRQALAKAWAERHPAAPLGEVLRRLGVYLGHAMPWDE
ncbi:MAG TPA: hypothetical protein VM598_07110, partial [Bdellovibrionota bacterium]|nr:hypothetical protein [Bdellovibrionota bacterium]